MSSESESSVGAESGASYSTVYHPSWHCTSLDLSGVLHQLSEHPRRDGLDIKKDHHWFTSHMARACYAPIRVLREAAFPWNLILGARSCTHWQVFRGRKVCCFETAILVPPILSWFGLTSFERAIFFLQFYLDLVWPLLMARVRPLALVVVVV